MCTITSSNVLSTKLWVIPSGSQFVQSQHLLHVLIEYDSKVASESDSKVAVNMIQCGYTNISYLYLVLADILRILETPNMHLELIMLTAMQINVQGRT
jgi:hypothetical protein